MRCRSEAKAGCSWRGWSEGQGAAVFCPASARRNPDARTALRHRPLGFTQADLPRPQQPPLKTRTAIRPEQTNLAASSLTVRDGSQSPSCIGELEAVTENRVGILGYPHGTEKRLDPERPWRTLSPNGASMHGQLDGRVYRERPGKPAGSGNET
jgi:hypothetical protein